MQKHKVKIIGIIFILTFLFVTSPLIIARAFRLALLPDKGKSFGCATCHTNPAGGGAKNKFGMDWERIAIPAGDKYTDVLANLDSDGDGFSNAEEFSADPVTKPWDPQSFPPGKPKAVASRGKQFITWAKIKSQF